MSNFARLSGVDRYDLQKLFARKDPGVKELGRISHLVKRTANKPSKTDISPEQILALVDGIVDAGGVIKFCKDHKKFAEKSVYQILSGRRKRITGKVGELFEHFKIPLG